jgi:signal transduction histidine kinase
MRIPPVLRAARPRSLAARTAFASALAAAVLFTAAAGAMRHATYDQQMGVAYSDAQQESNVILDAAAGIDMPSTSDDFGRFPYELVTSAGLVSSSSELKAFETDRQGAAAGHAFMPLPPYPVHDVDPPAAVAFPDGAAVRGDILAGTTTPVLESSELVANLRSQYDNPRALPGVPNDAQAAVYVFVTPGSAQAAVSTLDGTLYPGVPLAVLLVAAVAYLATRRALRPVEAIRARTAAVTAADPRERVRVPDTGDEIARLAATINTTLQRLDDAAQAQRRFVADAAHELRSPISSLLTTVEVAEAYPERADWPDTIATTAEQARRIQDLTEDLLLLARMDATVPANGPARTVDLAALARDTAAAPGARTADSADSADRYVSVTCQTDDEVPVHGDRGGLERVLRNLTDNARRHARSRVAVRVYATGDHAVIEVEDDGPGVPAADRERIFERFTRLDDARSRESGGFGLGLAIVRDIVERHHGTIEVADAAAGPGAGARFTVRIPRPSPSD